MTNNQKTIRVGIVGAGFARTTQIPGFQNCEGAEVVAIASRTREHAASVAREFRIKTVCDTWQQLVQRDDVDLVSVVTPPSTHCEITLAALANGKAVLCEKPMAMNAAEAEAMTTKARDVGVLALIDHELRFVSSRLRMRAMLHEGAIGNVRHVEYLFRSDYRGVLDRQWDWWSDIEMGGGTLGAIGSHAIDSFRWALDTDVSAVSCMLATHISARPHKASGSMRSVTTDDEAKLMFRFADSTLTRGTTGTALLSVVESGKYENTLTIFGTNGALKVEEDGGLSHSPAGSSEWRRVDVDQDNLANGMKDASWSRGFTVFSQEIIRALQDGRTHVESAATFADGHQIQRVLDAARRSHQSGCFTKVT